MAKLSMRVSYQKGTHQIWKAEEQLTVKAGNAGGVLVSVNKEEAKQMGATWDSQRSNDSSKY